MKIDGVFGGPEVLVLAPGRDGTLSCRVLEQVGRHCRRCLDAAQLQQRLANGTGALLIAEEMLDAPLYAWLVDFIAAQPAWSDLPVLVVAQDHKPALPPRAIEPLGNVTLLTRPMAMGDLTSAVATALRARERQLQVRQLLDQQAQEARRKDDFLAMLAHELRNPLSPVRYAAQALRKEAVSPRAGRLMDVIERQVAHMSRIITQLLDVSRLTRGMIVLERAPLDLAVLARGCVQSRQEAAAARDIALTIEAGAPVWIDGDGTRLSQVIENLLDNALKFSPAGSAVLVQVLVEDGWGRLEVRDHGDGLSAADLPLVFQPFVQADRTLDRAAGGLGLGLSMVKGLTELHGGHVEVHSDGLGQGSRFCVRLPRTEQPAASDPLPAPDNARSPAFGLRILLAEDNVDSADTLRLLLELSGHEVEVARDGNEAIAAARRRVPDLMLCDIGLPGMSGYDVARALRAEPALSGMRMIAITGYGTSRDREAALEAGFDGHFAKPIEPMVLMAELARETG